MDKFKTSENKSVTAAPVDPADDPDSDCDDDDNDDKGDVVSDDSKFV